MWGKSISFNKAKRGQTYEFIFKLYTFGGSWKIESDNEWKHYLYDIYHYTLRIASISYIVLALIDAYMKRHSMDRLIQNLSSTLIGVEITLKVYLLSRKINLIDKVRKNLQNCWHLSHVINSEENQKILLKAEQRTNLMTRGFLSVLTFEFLAYLFRPMLDHSLEERDLPLPFPDFFDKTETPTYQLLYCYELLVILINGLTVLPSNLIYWGFLHQICAHLDIIIENVKKLQRIYPTPNYARYIKGYEEVSEKEDNWTSEEIEMRKNMEKMSDERRTEEILKTMRANIQHHQAVIR